MASMLAQPEDHDQNEHPKAAYTEAEEATSGEEDEPEESRTKTPVPVTKGPSQAYDEKKRDPQFANAQNTCLWELVSTTPFLATNS